MREGALYKTKRVCQCIMMSGIAESIELCRRSRVQGNWHNMVYSDHGIWSRWDPDSTIYDRRMKPPMRDPERFVRRPRRSKSQPKRLSLHFPHRNEPLLSPDGEDSVVTPRSAGSRVNEQVYGVIGGPRRGGLGEHDVHVDGAEDLLERVECQAAKLTLDEVGPVLHDGLELDVAIPRLPSWDEVEHVSAVGRLPVFAALGAGQCHAEYAKEWLVCDLVPHAEEARVKVDLGGEGRNGQETGGSDDQEGRNRLIEESWVHVGCLLEDNDVAAGALGGADLP